jgi:hypothetical protein
MGGEEKGLQGVITKTGRHLEDLSIDGVKLCLEEDGRVSTGSMWLWIQRSGRKVTS